MRAGMGRIMNNEERHEYYASREWGLKRKAVRQRSGGLCERCKQHPATAVHHLTYIRLGHELLTDLQHVCDGCHDFLGGHSDYDPAASQEDISELSDEPWSELEKELNSSSRRIAGRLLMFTKDGKWVAGPDKEVVPDFAYMWD
jgi:hypothetical protein